METAGSGTESVASRLTRLLHNILALLQTRLELTRQEARDAIRDLVVAAVLLLIAVVLAVLAVPLAVTTGILVLALVVPVWVASGLVLVGMLISAGVLVLLARVRFRRPRVTLLQGLREDWRMIRDVVEGRQ